MKKSVLLIIYIILSLSVFSQDEALDKLMVRRIPDCQEIQYNCSFLIPDYFSRNKLDSVDILLKYWQRKCDLNETLVRTKLLYSMYKGDFSENELNNLIFQDLNEFNNLKMNLIGHHYFADSNYPLYVSDSNFYEFTSLLAKDLQKGNLNKTERFLTNFYADTSFSKFKPLESNDYDGSKIQNLYFRFKDSINHLPEMHFAFYTGYFQPLGNNKLLGNHVVLGFLFGGRFNLNNFDFVMDFKVGKPKEKYNVFYPDTLTETNKFTGINLGLEYNRAFISATKFEILALLGAGVELISAIPANEDTNEDGKTLTSPNFNAGLGLRYFYSNRSYLGLQARYHYLNFINKKGTDLTGNCFTIRFIIGFSGNETKNYYRKYFE